MTNQMPILNQNTLRGRCAIADAAVEKNQEEEYGADGVTEER